MYIVTKSELLSLRSTDGGLDSNLASAALSGMIASVITLLTAPLSIGLRISFLMAAITTSFLTVCFGVRAFIVKRKADKAFEEFVEYAPQSVSPQEARAQ